MNGLKNRSGSAYHSTIRICAAFLLSQPLLLSASETVNPVGGFEIGNGMVVNRIGGYRFKLPGLWEIGQAGTLTQVIAPALLGTPRPQLQVDVVKIDGIKKYTDSDENTSEQPWVNTEVGGLEGVMRIVKSDNSLLRTELRLKKSDRDYFLITMDYGVASSNTELYGTLNNILKSFHRSDKQS